MIALRLFNHEEMVFSATPATVGGHDAVLNIPGSALWGAALARLYAATPKDEKAIEALWLGKVRLSPGFPLTHERCPAFPMPQTFQEPKHEKGGIDNDRITDKLWNTRFGECKDKQNGDRIQTEAIKRTFLAADGSVAKPNASERGKAAVIEGDRRVEIGQFFQYEHLAAGQHWLAWIDFDADAEAEAERVAAVLTGRRLALGRSKRREFGGDVEVTRVKDWHDPRNFGVAQVGDGAENGLVLWCLSDLALADDYGTPILAPKPEALGISAKGSLDKAKSQITTRRNTPHKHQNAAPPSHPAVIAGGLGAAQPSSRRPRSRAGGDRGGLRFDLYARRPSPARRIQVRPRPLARTRPRHRLAQPADGNGRAAGRRNLPAGAGRHGRASGSTWPSRGQTRRAERQRKGARRVGDGARDSDRQPPAHQRKGEDDW